VIDTHCHLTDPRLGDQIDAVLDRAARVGVERVITVGCHPADGIAAIELCRRFPSVRCAVGIHPNYCHELEIDAVDAIRSLAARAGVVAVGEMGLDYHWKTVPVDRQKRFFEAQLQLAIDLRLPVVIHSREAIGDTLDMMQAFPAIRAVFHSFTGSVAEAGQIADRGFLVGFTGPVTYKKNDAIREAARQLPIDQIVVETDGPYLSPEPVRASRVNEPAHVMHVARRIAEVRGMSLEAFDAATTANARRLFGNI
jgi:TatD DNase family protein